MKRTRDLVYMAMYVALFAVLELLMMYVPILQASLGGKVNLAVIPLILASYHLGFTKSFIVIISSLLIRFAVIKPPTFVNALQLLLDYFVGYGVYALAVFFKDIKVKTVSLPVGVVVSNVLRFLASTASGALFFPGADTMKEIIIGSMIYNAPYMIGTLIVSFIVVMIVKPKLAQVLPAQ